ncbi:MAG: hypothetical protein AAB250_11530 [Bdellovibrionota bacterium]
MTRRTVFTTLLVSIALLALAPELAYAAPMPWKITKTQWTPSDEKNYQNFIVAIGESGCRTVKDCMKSAANPYRGTDPAGFDFWADCGRFPYLLRAYFAWKNGLPFSVVSAVKPVENLGTDIRYSPKGNYVVARRDAIQKTPQGAPGHDIVQQISMVVSTAMYRYNIENDQPTTGLFFDFVPTKIDRTGIRPGTVIYDANGHAAIVYRIETDGRIRFFDAHTDASITRSAYGEKFERASANSGAGFKNFRPLYLVNAVRQVDGSYAGGRITTIPMRQVADFSIEQYYGTEPQPTPTWRKAIFKFKGQSLPYYDWVRSRLAAGDLKYHPVDEMLNMMDTLCNDAKERVQAVEGAVAMGIHLKPQPNNLPTNIFGTSGEWESYSTPSRDARLKTSFVEVRKEVQRFVELSRQASPRIIYSGTNLVADLKEAYERTANACEIIYTRTNGTRVKLTYNHVAARLYSMSFDPYQCVERRWGADTAQELATCPMDPTKEAWYAAEQRLRNQISRPYDAKMGFSLDDLRAKLPGSGVDVPPNADLRAYLYSL